MISEIPKNNSFVETLPEISLEDDFPAFVPPPEDSIPPPEDFLPSPRKPDSVFKKWPGQKYLTAPFIFALSCACLSLFSWTDGAPEFSVSKHDVFDRGQYWQLLSALFAHADVVHVASNMLGVIFFGWMLRGYFSTFAFPTLPLALGVASNLITIYFYPSTTRLLGASGMLYAMVGLWLVLYLRFETRSFSQKLIRVFGFALTLLVPSSWEPNTSYLAHASGFFLGILAAFAFTKALNLRSRTRPIFSSSF